MQGKEKTDWEDLFDHRKLENIIHKVKELEELSEENKLRLARLEQLIDPEIIDEEKRN